MKKLAMVCIAALVAANTVAPAAAQHVTPANTNFAATGDAMVDKSPYGGPGPFFCTLTLNAKTGADLGGAHSNHANNGVINSGTNTGPTPCPAITVQPGTFRYDASLGWVIEGLLVKVGGVDSCYHPGPLPFSVTNTSPGMDIDFVATIYDSTSNLLACDVEAHLNTATIQQAG